MTKNHNIINSQMEEIKTFKKVVKFQAFKNARKVSRFSFLVTVPIMVCID